MMMIPSTVAKSKSNRKLFLRYIVSVLLIVIVFMPPVYLRSHYSSAKESEFEPAVALKQNLESFKTSTTNATALTIERRKEENGITATTSPSDLVLTAYLETPEKEGDGPTSKSILRSVSFPITNCLTLMREFPIDNFPLDDPYLPWIHDYFPSLDGEKIQFVAQNRRKCSGDVNHTEYWLPQISLFQKVPVVEEVTAMFQRRNGTTRSGEDGETKYRIASSYQEATHNSTRFQCRFHNIFENITMTTLSEFPFDYEFITWRKGKKAMFDLKGNDKDMFWLSQLLFSCPVPKIFRQLLLSPVSDEKYFSEQPALYVDLIPIRISTRDNYLLTYEQTGSKHFKRSEKINLTNFFGNQYVIPPMNDAGRIENLPICRRRHQQQQQNHSDKLISTNNDSKPNHSITKKHQKPYRLVACTWTSSSYARRGDDDFISDSASRLKEWIQFHLMVGIDHCEYLSVSLIAYFHDRDHYNTNNVYVSSF